MVKNIRTINEEERLARLKGISPADTGASLLHAIKTVKIASNKSHDSESLKSFGQELNQLADKLSFKARHSNNLKEKVEWISQVQSAKLFAKKLFDKGSMKSLEERTDRLKDISPKETPDQALRELKEAKKSVHNARDSIDLLRPALDILKKAISKILHKAIRSDSSEEKINMLQEAQAAKKLLEAKIGQIESQRAIRPINNSSSMGSKKVEKSNFTTPLHEKLKNAQQQMRAADHKFQETFKNYRNNKTPHNRQVALHSLRSLNVCKKQVLTIQSHIKKLGTLNEKTKQFKNAVNSVKLNNQKEKTFRAHNTPKNFRP